MEREELVGLRSNRRHWKAGIFYYCRADPRPIVWRRWRWTGWAINLGHRDAGSAIGVCVAMLGGPLAIGTVCGMVSPIAQAATVLICVALLVAGGGWIASRPR